MSQEKIWQYFQNEGVANFDEAVPRLRFLFQQASKLNSGVPGKILNIGIGNAWLEKTCQEAGWHAASLDPDEKAVERVLDAGVDGRVGVITEIPFENGTFSTVFCSEVLEHLTDEQLQLGLTEIVRVLKPGGRLIGTVPNREDLTASMVVCPDCGKVFHRWGHHQSFDHEKLSTRFENSGFTIEKLTTYAFPVYSRKHSFNRLRQLLRWVLGRMGSLHVHTNLYFCARKPSS